MKALIGLVVIATLACRVYYHRWPEWRNVIPAGKTFIDRVALGKSEPKKVTVVRLPYQPATRHLCPLGRFESRGLGNGTNWDTLRLRALERENVRLKRLLAERVLESDVLKEGALKRLV